MPDSKVGIKIAGRKINNLRYADDTTLIAEAKEELKNLLMKVKENERAGLKLNIKKTMIMASSLMANRWGKSGNSDRFYFLGLEHHSGW